MRETKTEIQEMYTAITIDSECRNHNNNNNNKEIFALYNEMKFNFCLALLLEL